MKKWDQYLQANYGTPSIELVSGKGSVVKDADGKIYLDFLAGIATNILGHAHPAIVKAITKQASQLSHVSNFYAHLRMPPAEFHRRNRYMVKLLHEHELEQNHAFPLK